MPLPAFMNTRVLVVGDVMLDRYWSGHALRISPEAPVPVVGVDAVEDRPGGAANVALNLAALGVDVTLMGVVGDDEAGQTLQRLLASEGVASECHMVPERPTTLKLRVMSRRQQLMRMDFEQPVPDMAAQALVDRLSGQLDQVDLVVLSDYAKGALAKVADIIALCRARGLPVLVDPKGRDYDRYQGATLLTPNLSEFEAVMGVCAHDDVLLERGRALRERLSLDALLITLSERGMLLVAADADPIHLPTHAQEVADVTGAGDTVLAVLAAAMAAGESLQVSASLANLAAGIVVGKLGTGFVRPAELQNALRRQAGAGSSLLSEADLLQAVAEAKAQGERIVMTNGCFDILHAGHVAYLEQASRLGDRLIVAVNDDASVSRLKGPSRPVNPLERRMAVLAGLASVDWVVGFSEDTPEALICRVCPDVLVKGGDYQPEEIAGGECVRAAGGEVRVLPFVEGVSTTGMIERINAS